MCLDELADASVDHPLRYHHKLGIHHCCSQQRQYIRMMEEFPCYSLLAEPLHSHNQLIYTGFQRATPITHLCNLLTFVLREYPQNLDRNVMPLMFAHPHISGPTPVWRVFRRVVGK